jgi:ethanolamine-phosphate cytidylyltransferase
MNVQYGDYVIGGVFNDSLVNQLEGGNLPIMNLHERVLSLLGCKYVDDVLIDAPSVLTTEMIKSLNISAVVCLPENKVDREVRYKVAMDMGIYHELSPISDLTVNDIIERIHQHNERFMAKFERKKKAEDEYYANRYQLNTNTNKAT